MSDAPEQEIDAPTLNWCAGRTRTTANWSPLYDQSWSAFVQWLKPDQPATSKEVDPYVGGTLANGRRTARTVEQRFFLTLDADYAEQEFPVDVELLLYDEPYLIHTTWRHTPEAPRYRLIIPLSRGVTPNEYKELTWLVMNRLGADQFDKTTAQAERFMWGPSTQDATQYFYKSANVGTPYLPVDAWLASQHGASESRNGQGQANPPAAPPATGSGAHSASVATAEDIERAEEILASAVDDVLHLEERGEFAGRNEAVFHLLPVLLRFAEAGALDEDLVLDSLFNAAQQVSSDEPYTQHEFDMSVRSARQYAEEQGPTLPDTTRTKLAQADFEGVEDIWSRTPQLQHIAQAADSMGRNRLALLAVLLTRILVETDPGICLPGARDGAIGSRAPLNLGVAMVGASGQGKTTFAEESEELLGRNQKHYTRVPSTGQGLIQEYLKWDADEGENVLVPDPKRLFVVDEIDKLGALAKDQGSTLMAELRTLLTGSTTGSSNARRELNRILHARTYNFQIVLGVQPARAEPLLSGRDAGTPQRFVWVTITDPKTALHPNERPAWPGPLDWNDAFMLEFELGEPLVEYPEWLKEELRDNDYKVSLENAEGGKMSRFGHQNLLRLKVAAGIAFLHESAHIEDEHVEIADQIVAASKRVQMDCERVVAESMFLSKKASARTEERVRDALGSDRVKKLLDNARKRLIRASGEWVPWYDLRPSHRDRSEWGEPLWEALCTDKDIETEDSSSASKRRARVPE